MNKRPSLQFYPADWLKDPDLQMCSMNTIGIWINLMCRMWEAKEEGILKGKIGELALLTGARPMEFKKFIKEAEEHKFCDVLQTVTDCYTVVTIKCRRMNKAFLERERVKIAMQRKRLRDCDVPSSTSSSSSTTNKEYMSIFNEARKYYPGEKRGLDTEFNYLCKVVKEWKEIIPLLLPAIKTEESRRASLESARKFVPSWKHFKMWIYNRCWEVTAGQTISPKENAAAEQKALEKEKNRIRNEDGKRFQQLPVEKLRAMRKDKYYLPRWWLIDEIINERKSCE